MEFANGGTILDQMKTGVDRKEHSITGKVVKRLPEKVAKDYMRQTTTGLQYLHSLGIAHKDLKLENLLIVNTSDGKQCIKVTDFGLSRFEFDPKSGVHKLKIGTIGTVNYMSPQILRLHIYDEFGEKVSTLRTYNPFSADCWALGVCLYVMVIANFPFIFKDRKSYNIMYENMKNRNYEIPYNFQYSYTKECLDLIYHLLDPKADTRLDISLVLSHKWFKN